MPPSSTRNQDKARDPNMHQTRKGHQGYFGITAHIGVERSTKVIHAVVATAAQVQDGPVLPDLLQGEEPQVWGDSAYQGQTSCGNMPPRRRTLRTAAIGTRAS